MDTPRTTVLLKGTTYTAKSAAAEEPPPNLSASSNFWRLFKPHAIPLEPAALYG